MNSRPIIISGALALLACAIISPALAQDAAEKGAAREWVVATQRPEEGYNFANYTPDIDVSFSSEGATFKLDAPCLKRGDDLWVPLASLLPKLEVMFFKTGDRGCAVIRGDGMPYELVVGSADVLFNKEPSFKMENPLSLYEGRFMLSLKSLAKLLGTEYAYNASANTVELANKAAAMDTEEFMPLILPKPPPPKKPEVVPSIVAVREPGDIMAEPLPNLYRKDLDLNIDTSGSYFWDERSYDRTRQFEWYLSGRAYNYTVDGHLRFKDFRTAEKERFMEDGEFFGLANDLGSMKFLDNYYTIPTLRSQSQSYFGGEVVAAYAPHKTTFVYGQIDNTVSGPADIGAVRYFGDMYIAKQGYVTPSKNFKTDETVIVLLNHADEIKKRGTTLYPRQGVVFVTENTLSPYDGLNINSSLGVSNYKPDNHVNDAFCDEDILVGVDYAQREFGFKANYERIGQQYASLGIPSTYQDFEGMDFSSNFAFTKNWSANIGSRFTKNNIEKNPRIPTNFTRDLTMSTSIMLPWQQTLSGGYTLDEQITRGGDADRLGNRYEDFRVDYVKMWGNMTAQISFDHYTLEPFSAATGGSVTDMCSMSLFDYYPELNGSYARLYQSYRKVKNIANASYTTEYLDNSVSGRLNITRYLSVNADWRVSVTRRENFSDTAPMSLIIGTEFNSSPVSTFSFDFSLTNYDLYKEKTWIPKYYTYLFKGRHLFNYSTPEKWGRARVFVFRDLNSNGTYDPGESGIPRVRVYAAKGRSAYTNEKGYASIEKIVPGDRMIKVDLTKLPLDVSVRGPSIKPVTILPLQTVKVEFPVVRTGRLKGRVYIDRNNDGKFDRAVDEPVPNVRVYISPEGKDTLTFSDGTYIFDYWYPGEYQVCADPETIPAGYKMSSPAKLPITVKEDQEIKDLDFRLQSRPIEMQVF